MNHEQPFVIVDVVEPPLARPSTHVLHRDVPQQIASCHTQIERAAWFSSRRVSVRRVSVFDPQIRRYIVMWYPTVGNAIVRYDGPEGGHATRQSALEEGYRFRDQAVRFAQGDRDVPQRNRA